MAEPISPIPEKTLNESDSEFLSALEQVFATPSPVKNTSETQNKLTEFTDITLSHNHNTELLNQDSETKNVQTTHIEKNQTHLIPDNVNDPPRIESLLHTQTIKPTINTPFQYNTQPIESAISQPESTESIPIINNTIPTHNSLQHSPLYIKNWHTITLWLTIASLITATIALWQMNELHEQIFRLETMNKTLELKLLETLNRIDIIRNKFAQTDQILRQLEQQPAIALPPISQ